MFEKNIQRHELKLIHFVTLQIMVCYSVEGLKSKTNRGQT